MARVRCAECGRPVSQYADRCPRCGVGFEPMSDARYAQAQTAKAATRRKDGRFTLGVIGLLVGLVVLAVIFGPSAAEQKNDAEREFRKQVESLPEQQRQRESDQFWNGVGMEKGKGHS